VNATVNVPVLEWLETLQVPMLDDRAHHPAIIDVQMVQVLGHVGQRIDMHAGRVLPGQVLYLGQVIVSLKRSQELRDGLLCGVAPQYQVHLVIADELLMEIGGGITAE
jgi:hypothetical protein